MNNLKYMCALIACVSLVPGCNSPTGGDPGPSPTIVYDDISFGPIGPGIDSVNVYGTGIHEVTLDGSDRLTIPHNYVITAQAGRILRAVAGPHLWPDSLICSDATGPLAKTLWPTTFSYASLSVGGYFATITVIDSLHDTIYLSNADGTGIPAVLAADEGVKGPSAISPDGRYLAYYTSSSSGLSVIIKDLTLNQRDSVHLNNSSFGVPFFDGPNLSWKQGTPELACSDGANVYIVSTEGAILKTIASAVNAEWSPQDNRLGWQSAVAGGGLNLSLDEGKTSSLISQSGRLPHWSPDGRFIAYKDSTLKVLNVDSHQITDTHQRGHEGWVVY